MLKNKLDLLKLTYETAPRDRDQNILDIYDCLILLEDERLVKLVDWWKMGEKMEHTLKKWEDIPEARRGHRWNRRGARNQGPQYCLPMLLDRWNKDRKDTHLFISFLEKLKKIKEAEKQREETEDMETLQVWSSQKAFIELNSYMPSNLDQWGY